MKTASAALAVSFTCPFAFILSAKSSSFSPGFGMSGANQDRVTVEAARSVNKKSQDARDQVDTCDKQPSAGLSGGVLTPPPGPSLKRPPAPDRRLTLIVMGEPHHWGREALNRGGPGTGGVRPSPPRKDPLMVFY